MHCTMIHSTYAQWLNKFCCVYNRSDKVWHPRRSKIGHCNVAYNVNGTDSAASASASHTGAEWR